MAITADYHLHSYFSGDSKSPMEDMVLSGIEHGLTHICFTEHHDPDFPYEAGEEPVFLLNTDSYLHELTNLRAKYAERIRILFGVELGIQPHLLRELQDYTKSYDFDFIIASSHICHKKDPYQASFYDGRTDREAYEEYFNSIYENLQGFSNFDVYGHLDYAVRYGTTKNREYSYSQHADIIDKILRLLIEKEKGIELNTGGFRAGLGEPNPCVDMIKRYKELGGELITIGSDAHKPEALCEYFDKARDILLALGFKYYCIFKERFPEYKVL